MPVRYEAVLAFGQRSGSCSDWTGKIVEAEMTAEVSETVESGNSVEAENSVETGTTVESEKTSEAAFEAAESVGVGETGRTGCF